MTNPNAWIEFDVETEGDRVDRFFQVTPDQMPNYPMLFAALEGKTPARAVVDDADSPSWCALRVEFGTTFVSGSVPPAAFEWLSQYGHLWIVETDDAPTVRPQTPGLEVVDRIGFSDHAKDNASLDALLQRIPAGAELLPMDAKLLARCLWVGEIEEACGSAERFLEVGNGLCLVEGDTILCEAYAAFWCRGWVEIGVITHKASQGRGLAAATCAALVKDCEQRGVETYWSCERTNPASAAVARKLGYRREVNYRWIYLPALNSENGES